MRSLGNIIWHFPFFGFLSAFGAFLMGLLLVALIVTAPIGRGLIEYSRFLLAPYSRQMIPAKELRKEAGSVWAKYEQLVSILWFPFGLLLSCLLIFQIAFMFLSIIGIPLAIVLAKSVGTYLNPVGKICVTRAVAIELGRQEAKAYIASQVAE